MKIIIMTIMITTCSVAATLETIVDTLSIITIPVSLLPILHVLDPTPTYRVTSVVPITAFTTSCARTTLTQQFRISARSSEFWWFFWKNYMAIIDIDAYWKCADHCLKRSVWNFSNNLNVSCFHVVCVDMLLSACGCFSAIKTIVQMHA